MTGRLTARIALASLSIAVLTLTGAGYARADPTDTIDQPDLNGVICQQMALGQTPGEIADELHRGDLRRSIWQTGQQVWDALPSC